MRKGTIMVDATSPAGDVAGKKENVKKMYSNGARLLPVFVLTKGKQINLLDMDAPPNIMDNKFPIGRTMFYRLDNFY